MRQKNLDYSNFGLSSPGSLEPTMPGDGAPLNAAQIACEYGWIEAAGRGARDRGGKA